MAKSRWITFIISFCLLLSAQVQAQISHGGHPLPLTMSRSHVEELYVTLPTFDLAEQLRIDTLEATDLRNSSRFAYKFMTDYTPENAGVHFTLKDGTDVWRLGIRSEGAKSLNLLFTEYHLPVGAQLFVYNQDQSKILGAFNHLNNSDRQMLPIMPINDEVIIIEYQEPANVAFHGRLRVGEVNHGYQDWFKMLKGYIQSFKCMPTVTCFREETDLYDDIERSVVLLLIDGTLGCTGVLLNNTAQDGTPYLLTASHCLNKQFQIKNPDYEEVAGKILTVFNYNSPQCDTITIGPHDQTLASAHIRAVNEKTDLALLKLHDIPPLTYNPYYAGWNAANKGPEPYSSIHHPRFTPKRICEVLGDIKLEKYDIADFINNAHYHIFEWAIGCTADGSSGAPLFDGNKRVIGALSGGSSYCKTPYNDYYYALQSNWDSESDSLRQLKCWLDPIGKGTAVCNGWDPNDIETGNESIKESTAIPFSLIANRQHRQIHLHFETPIQEAYLTLITPTGTTIRQYTLHQQDEILPVGNLARGAYIVKIAYNNRFYTEKILF